MRSLLAALTIFILTIAAAVTLGAVLEMRDDYSGEVARCVKQYNVDRSQCP